MRASTAVGLLLVSTASIFGIFSRHATHPSIPPGPEPVYVDGVMGVCNPDTGEFVPCTSPLFDETCDLIQLRREQSAGVSGGIWSYQHHWNYYPGHTYFYGSPFGPAGGATGARASSGYSGFSAYTGASSSSSAAHAGSVRGGIGSTGHSHGGSGS